MRLKLLLVTATAAIGMAAMTAAPASAQGFRTCAQARANNQVGGALLGGILGGVLGSNVAAHGHRGDGTAVGAVLGGMVGSAAGRDGTSCAYPDGPPGPGYAGPPAYGPNPADYPPPGAYSEPRYDDRPHHRRSDRDLYPSDTGSYNDDYAGRDCSQATQITRLPDGTEIRRPVEACRDAYYGDWQVRN